ncbi:hypothetical protein AB0O91_36280 [Kitasatospora sp. NPDC089797]|uniref:hypothetical protein n=1 Tax=Kitasatospora sp. NPDC089797 TaxID=3155298 RepID=UPI003424364E
MRSQTGRALAVGVAGLAAAGSLLLTAPTAQAATTAHCTTASGGISLTTPTLGPSFTAALSNCGGSFTDLGAPYTFTLASISVGYINGRGMLSFYVYSNLTATCTTASVSGNLLQASGCTYAATS